jgi:hypothetical protein
MPFLADVRRSLEGAALLARLDPSGMERFDLSVEGFWRSFSAALIAAPPYGVLLADRYGREGMGPHVGQVLSAEFLGYALGWIAFPIAALFLTRMLGLGARYVALIVAGNWAAVLQVGLLAAAVIVAGFLPESQRGPIALTVTLAAVAYQWFVVRAALQTSGLIAFGIVVVDVLLSVLLNLFTDSLLQPA